MENTNQKTMVKTGDENPVNRTSTKLDLLKEMDGMEVWTDAFGDRFGERVCVGVKYPNCVNGGKTFKPTKQEVEELWNDLMEREGITTASIEAEFTPEYCKAVMEDY